MADKNCEKHPDRKHYARGMCHSCYVGAWTKDNPNANTGNNWRKNNPERGRYLSRRATLKKRGTTPEEYDQLWKEQDGKCANPGCRAPYPITADDHRWGALHPDHCHETGQMRGLLCPSCNIALGMTAENPERLLGLIKYLEMYDVQE